MSAPLPLAAADYDLLLDRAGVTSLTPEERTLLLPVLPMIDAKISRLRACAARKADIAPTDPTR